MREENVSRQAKGTMQNIGGRIKQAFGRWFGHEQTQVEGRAQELRGRENVDRGMAAERREGKSQEIGGAVERKTGEVLGSERMTVEGRSKELEGQSRQDLNR